MKKTLKLLLAAIFLFGAVPANTVTQEVVKQKATTQYCQIALADDSADIKKKKKGKKKKIKKGKKKKKGFFSKVFGSK